MNLVGTNVCNNSSITLTIIKPIRSFIVSLSMWACANSLVYFIGTLVGLEALPIECISSAFQAEAAALDWTLEVLMKHRKRKMVFLFIWIFRAIIFINNNLQKECMCVSLLFYGTLWKLHCRNSFQSTCNRCNMVSN